ncbi:putative protein serine/threonine kinase [Cavenderia fasciculata]|uniref:non-specific serine/threonine protein kinase n=1 Tax=Cavenderia fasciculata TaxID=261658 RepID=F4Q3W5_CACFS|nr:putative protein serine/threonine kinase [Cavenderia fasciculata]EGG17721.1 putative protein serine/threonine kinase [Cavenderia fasciculata]|eukprot:XP_004356205.1 putative protein serine/threonine kinase [Cavenderia fasciculata]
MGLLGLIFKKKKDPSSAHGEEKENKEIQEQENEGLVSSDTSIAIAPKKSKSSKKQSPPPSNTTSNTSDNQTSGGRKDAGEVANNNQHPEDDEPMPTIIMISNSKGLQKSDRKWLSQINLSEEVINTNFPTIVHIMNFLRKKDSIYYKYIEQPEQLAQIKESLKDQMPSVIVSNTAAGGQHSSANSSDEESESKGHHKHHHGRHHHHHHHHHRKSQDNNNNGHSPTNTKQEDQQQTTNNNNIINLDVPIIHITSAAATNESATSSSTIPTTITTTSHNNSINHVIISNPTTHSGKSISYIMEARKRRIDQARIFLEPGVFAKFPDEIETASHKLLVEGNPKEQYKNLDFEARGGFGSVFAAKNKNPHSQYDRAMVALKKMPHRTPKQKRMNLAEIGFMKFCKHPNIVTFLSSYQKNEEVWMIMEFMEGGTLREAISNFIFCESRIAYVAKEILKGIQYMHSHSLCHRDLKSSNIMISMKGEIKLIDFGLAIDFSIEREDIHMCGSPFWMPPEQIQGQPHSFSADIWSFGVCIVEMINRKVPHHNSRLKAMISVVTDGIKFTKAEHPDWSDEILDFLDKCLQVDPTKRSTAQQLLEHPFLLKCCTLKEIKEILPALFMSNTLSKQGLE